MPVLAEAPAKPPESLVIVVHKSNPVENLTMDFNSKEMEMQRLGLADLLDDPNAINAQFEMSVEIAKLENVGK